MDEQSDPSCTSLGCETEHSFPSKDVKDPVKYSTDTTLDSDIIDTKSNMKNAEQKLGPWELKEEDVQVQNEVHLKEKLQTKAEKAVEFKKMRDLMMSNWGTK